MGHRFKNWLVRNDGTAPIEGAVVFPILIFCIFGVFVAGNYLMGLNSAQRYVEKSARMTRMLDNPTTTQIEAVLAENIETPMFGAYNKSVTIITDEAGQRYANLNIGYTYLLEIPFIDPIRLNSESNTRVPLRNIPG